MGHMMATYRENLSDFRDGDYGLENALAKYVRNRWMDKTVAYVAHEWTLSEAEAKNVVYANASKNTLNKILHHKRGGPKLFVQLVFDATNYNLERYIVDQAEEAAHERATWEARERHLAILQARVADRHSLVRGAAQQARAGRSEHARLGAGEAGATVERVERRGRP